MRKRLFATILLLCAVLLAGGCAAKKALPPCAQVAEAIRQSHPMAELTELGEKQIAKYLLIEKTEYADASVWLDATRATPECVCVLTAPDAAGVAALERALQTYRDDLLAQYRDYRPEETPKLENAVLQTRDAQVALVVAPDAETAREALSAAWK